jgi:hypothetical protein
MDSDFVLRVNDYFTPSELIQLFDFDGVDLINWLIDMGFLDDAAAADLEEIMDHGQ